MTNVTINWAMIGSFIAALAGVAGSVLTPIYGTQMATGVQQVLQAVSGLLLLIPTWHIASTASYTSKLRAQNVYARSASGLAAPQHVPGNSF